MNKTILWIIANVVLAAFLLFWHFNVMPFDFSDFIQSADFIGTLLTVFLFSSVLAVIIALIPIKNNNYKTRLSFCFPISIISICLVFGFTFYSNGPHYDTIKPEPSADCRSIHDGTFKCDDVIIQRTGDLQIEKNTKTNEEDSFEVIWLNDCEYQLKSVRKTLKVKIVSVDQNGYDCYVLYRGRTSKRIKILWQNKTLGH